MNASLFPNEPQLARYNREWVAAGQIRSDLTLTPFTAKALYAFGMMRHLVESAGWSLKHEPPYGCFYIAAYLLSCGAIELFGRCVSGDDDEKYGSTRRLKCGFKQMATIPQNVDDDSQVMIVTNHKDYTIADCAALRNFCAHGGSVGQAAIDVEFIDEILKKLSEAVDDYWNRLMSPSDSNARGNLATAAVAPLFAGSSAILIKDVYKHVRSGQTITGDLMYSDAWQTYK